MLMTNERQDAFPDAASDGDEAMFDPEWASQVLGDQIGALLRITALSGSGLSGSGFVFRFRQARLRGIRMLHAAISPSRIVGGSGDRPVLVLPLSGSLTATRGRRGFAARPGENALLVPANCTRTAECEGGFEGLLLSLAPDRVERAAKAMLGTAAASRPALANLLRCSEPAELPLRYRGADLLAVFHHLHHALHGLGQVPNLVPVSGLEECLYRAIVLLLLPEHVIESGPSGAYREASSFRLDRVCRHIMHRLPEGPTLTELQEFSGLSARALQYAFRRAYGLTPMQWMTDQKLIAVRSALRHARAGTTVTQVAQPYFSNLGDFARRYRARFGELPSVTLARAHFDR